MCNQIDFTSCTVYILLAPVVQHSVLDVCRAVQARYRAKRRAKLQELEATAAQLDQSIAELQQSEEKRDALKVW